MSCNCKVIKGPCAITWNSTTFLTEGDITVRANIETFEPMADYKGKLDARLRSLAYTISFKPVSTWAVVDSVLDYFNDMSIGTDVFRPSGSDLTLVITPLTDQAYTAGDAGKIFTFKKAALTGVPSLRLSTGAQILDTMTFTCIRSTGTEQGANESFFSVATWTSILAASAITAASVDTAEILTMPWLGTWAEDPDTPGATNPWYSFDAIDGFNVSFDYALNDVKTDNCGFIGSTINNLSAKITGIPCIRTGDDLNPSASAGSYEFMESSMLADSMFNDAGGLTIGESLAGVSANHGSLVTLGGDNRKFALGAADPVTGTEYTITFNRAALTGTGVRYGSQPLRQGETEWTAYAGPGAKLLTIAVA